ncbi:MAG: hypothetical protein GY929_20730 [Actinomycetia bacterium]|nr:hypothetical protein [Actinomycetes bacterium]
MIGEEAADTDPGLVSLIDSCPAVWLLDPLDGTANFASGSPDYSVMVAYVEDGIVTSSWMWNPALQEMSIASR